MGGFAWVTLATNDSYSLGALVLAHSLKAVGTTHQLAVLVTPGVTNAMRDKLSAVFNLIEEVNVLDSRDEANLRLLKRPELGITFTKLHCWRLTQYEKCVFLDADTLVLQQCDELFEREELSAAPDVGWPDCFNSGVFVYRPSLETYDKLIQFALEKGSFDGGDQGLLNLYFSDWAHKDISRHLPFIYNMCSTACYSYLPAYKQFGANAKIIHFIGAQKPWLQYFNTESRKVQPSADSSHLQEVLQRWWDIFCSLIHPHLSPAMAGLAGAFAQLTLGVPRTQEQDAFENVLRKQAWEVGNIDYLGRDSFDNIWSKISETLGAETTTSLALAPEPEPSAPAQSQSESAPPQEEVKPVQSSDAPIETTTATDNLKVDLIESSALVESSQDQQQIPQATSESAIVPPSTETVEPEPQVPGSTVSDVVKEGESQPLPEIAPTPKESVAEPAVCPIPQKKEAKVEEPKVTEPQVDVPKEEIKIPDPQAAVTTIDAKPTEPQVESTEASSIPQTKEADSKVAEPELPKETVTSGELVCSLPEQKDVPKLPDAQAISSQPEQKEAQVPSAQPETPKAAQPEVAKVTPQVEETSKEPIPAATKELDTSQPAEALPEKPEISAQPVPSPAEPAVKEVQAASEATASKGTKKAASSKDSPRTKVTEATPPATPGSPLVEKTKEALAAEASIPDTPPPTEGGSTPTPPPRKTDKPKKVAAKPKK